MTTTPRTDAVNNDAIAIPSLQNLLAYLNYQYPATQGNIPLNELCLKISTLETELAEALKRQKEMIAVLGEVATQRDQLKKELKGAQDFAEGFTREITRQQELRDNLQSQLAALTTLWLSK